MGFLDDARKKLSKAVDQHGDKISQGLDKAGALADQKTGGKHGDKIRKGVDKAKEGLDKLDGRRDDLGGPTDGPATPPVTRPTTGPDGTPGSVSDHRQGPTPA